MRSATSEIDSFEHSVESLASCIDCFQGEVKRVRLGEATQRGTPSLGLESAGVSLRRTEGREKTKTTKLRSSDDALLFLKKIVVPRWSDGISALDNFLKISGFESLDRAEPCAKEACFQRSTTANRLSQADESRRHMELQCGERGISLQDSLRR